jgi:hypothetical protein
VSFVAGTTAEDRQRAIDLVGGTVVGGVRFGTEEGRYYVRVPTRTREDLLAARQRVASLPFVDVATVYLFNMTSWAVPADGSGWGSTDWRVRAESPSFGGRWALEAINAPHAWGCSAGTLQTRVAAIDDGDIPSTSELANVVSFPLISLGFFDRTCPKCSNHAASVLAGSPAFGPDLS